MLVRVVDAGLGMTKSLKANLGRTGRVVKDNGESAWGRRFSVEGCMSVLFPGKLAVFPEAELEVLPNEHESSTWEEVQKLTNWNPTREKA